jgi:hypothetical protein
MAIIIKDRRKIISAEPADISICGMNKIVE